MRKCEKKRRQRRKIAKNPSSNSKGELKRETVNQQTRRSGIGKKGTMEFNKQRSEFPVCRLIAGHWIRVCWVFEKQWTPHRVYYLLGFGGKEKN